MTRVSHFVKGVWILFAKELKISFTSPLIYILSAMFSLMMGWLFFNYLILAKNLTTLTMVNSVLVPIFGNMNFIFLFLAPMITMGHFAEEKKGKTISLLHLSMLSDLQIVLAKYMASLVSVMFMLMLTMVFPIILACSGYTDWGTVLASYLGIILSVMCYLAVGIFASSLTENQIISAVVTFCILLGLMLLVLSINATSNQFLADMVRYLSIPAHYESFVRGEIKSYDLVYFVSFIGFFLFLTRKSLDARNW